MLIIHKIMPAIPVILLTIFKLFIPRINPNIPNVPGKIMSKKNDSRSDKGTDILSKNNNPNKVPINPKTKEIIAFRGGRLPSVFIVLIFI